LQPAGIHSRHYPFFSYHWFIIMVDLGVLVLKEDIHYATRAPQLKVSTWVMKRDAGQLVFLH
jgi:hypothetical protein